ncbi:unnamed protein product [Gongylonema pulchrum]|uniref:Uncharacterized protein n=1 Tax=Gongylonema pulchrum TaxID=637853 RepID=A0A3P6P3L5_9BILA|nr:unnamed protein product [Gongylonema pulchrum]
MGSAVQPPPFHHKFPSTYDSLKSLLLFGPIWTQQRGAPHSGDWLSGPVGSKYGLSEMSVLPPELDLCEDARSRFTHTKALFEQLERGGQSPPIYYSPRPSRPPPPPLPPKPSLQCPSSPLSQCCKWEAK